MRVAVHIQGEHLGTDLQRDYIVAIHIQGDHLVSDLQGDFLVVDFQGDHLVADVLVAAGPQAHGN